MIIGRLLGLASFTKEGLLKSSIFYEKSLLVLILLVIAIQHISAQKIHFTDPSNTWRGVSIDGSAPSPTTIYTLPYHYQYGRDTNISNKQYHILNYSVAVRDDTAGLKVYFRFIETSGNGSTSDTLEHVLYDYTLAVGDTFRMDYGNQHFYDVVGAIDSTLINGIYHKVWHFQSARGASFGSYVLGNIIEGIGSVAHPLWPINFIDFEHAYQLQCFSNSGENPLLGTPVRLPFYASNTVLGPPTTDYFNNSTSCTLAVNTINSLDTKPVVFPNPGGKNIAIRLAQSPTCGTVLVYDFMGRMIAEIPFKSSRIISIGNHLSTDGLYSYRVCNAENNVCSAGVFLFRSGE